MSFICPTLRCKKHRGEYSRINNNDNPRNVFLFVQICKSDKRKNFLQTRLKEMRVISHQAHYRRKKMYVYVRPFGSRFPIKSEN